MHTLRIFLFTFIIALGFKAQAQDLRRLDMGQALVEVLSAFEDARFDLDGYYEVVQKFEKRMNKGQCNLVSSDVIVEHFSKAIDHYREFFPDEALPYDQALEEFQELVGVGLDYRQCVETRSNDYEVSDISHYSGLETGIQLSFQFIKEL